MKHSFTGAKEPSCVSNPAAQYLTCTAGAGREGSRFNTFSKRKAGSISNREETAADHSGPTE